MTTESETSTALEANGVAASAPNGLSDFGSQTRVDQGNHDWQRGQRILAALKHAARAAHLQAQAAELEYALSQATRGAATNLKRWLEQYDQLTSLEEPNVESTNPAAAAMLNSPQHAAPQAEELTVQPPSMMQPLPDSRVHSGWDGYLEFARQRLAKRAQAIIAQRQTTTTSDSPHTDALLDSSTIPSSTIEPTELTTHQEPHPRVRKFSSEHASAAPSSRSDVRAAVVQTIDRSEQPDEHLPAADSVRDLAAFDLGTSKGSYARTAHVNRRLVRGMGLSLLAHSLALLGLLMITLRLPRESASLGSQVVSVQRVTEELQSGSDLELPEPLEIDLPLETTNHLEAANPSVPLDLTDTMPQSLTPASAAMQPIGPSGLPAATSNLRDAGRGANSSAGRALPNSASSGGKFFGAGAGGNFFCYVVDSSGSMRGRAWESAKLELLRSLTTLAPTQRFYIVFFAQDISALPEPGGIEPARSGLLASPENIDHARRWIDSVKLDRGGPPNEALQLAIEREPDAIYLLTDGVTQADVCGFLRKINRMSDIVSGEQVRVPIHTIAYHSLDGQQLLRQLARENAGQFHYVPAK